MPCQILLVQRTPPGHLDRSARSVVARHTVVLRTPLAAIPPGVHLAGACMHGLGWSLLCWDFTAHKRSRSVVTPAGWGCAQEPQVGCQAARALLAKLSTLEHTGLDLLPPRARMRRRSAVHRAGALEARHAAHEHARLGVGAVGGAGRRRERRCRRGPGSARGPAGSAPAQEAARAARARWRRGAAAAPEAATPVS